MAWPSWWTPSARTRWGCLKPSKTCRLVWPGGPPLWRYIPSVADDATVRGLLNLLWTDLDIGSSACASKSLSELVQANTPSGKDKTICVGECHAQQLKHAVREAWSKPGPFPKRGRDRLSALKPSEIGTALDDLSSLGVCSPIFATPSSEIRSEIADAFPDEGLSRCQAPASGPP